MIRFHHVNLGVPPEQLESEMAFLTDVLGYQKMELDPRLKGVGARWFESEDGAQVHLSVDPEHQPAAKAHVAIEFGSALTEVEERLAKADIDFDQGQMEGFPRVITCRDPAGNRWELRGEPVGV